MHCSQGNVHRPAADNLAADRPAACTSSRCMRARHAISRTTRPKPCVCLAAQHKTVTFTSCWHQRSSTSNSTHRSGVICSSLPSAPEPSRSRFTPEYIDKLHQLQPMMTPHTIRHLQDTLPAEELPQLQQLLDDLDSLASGWYQLADVEQAPEQAAVTAGHNTGHSMDTPASFDSYLRQVVFSHVPEEQLDELLDLMGRDTLQSISTLYEDLVRFQQQPHDQQQLEIKYQQLSERMAAIMQEVMMEGNSSSSSGNRSSSISHGLEPQMQPAVEMDKQQSSERLSSTVENASRRRSKPKPSARTAKRSAAAAMQSTGAVGSDDQKITQQGSMETQRKISQGHSWLSDWSSAPSEDSSSSSIPTRTGLRQSKPQPNSRPAPRLQLVHALSEPQLAQQHQPGTGNSGSISNVGHSVTATSDDHVDSIVELDGQEQQRQGHQGAPATSPLPVSEWLVKQPPSSAWAWTMQRPAPGNTVGALAKQAARAGRGAGRSSSRQPGLKAEDAVST